MPPDTILVSRTEQSRCDDCAGGVAEGTEGGRLDIGSIVLTGEDSCLQTIAHMEDGKLSMMEVIKGTRKM